jgi:alpha-L-fucosidase 2
MLNLFQFTAYPFVWVSESFCSHPRKACLQHITASGRVLPITHYSFSAPSDLPPANITCLDDSTISMRGHAAEPGMLYELIGRAYSNGGTVTCFQDYDGIGKASLVVEKAREAWFIWVGGTEYNMDAGDAEHGFSFKGPDPHPNLLALLSETSGTPYWTLLAEHVSDFKAATGPFSLDLGQTVDRSRPMDVLKEEYGSDKSSDDKYIEWVLFNYGRYLLVSSARGVLPANLQGKWAEGAYGAWGVGRFVSRLCISTFQLFSFSRDFGIDYRECCLVHVFSIDSYRLVHIQMRM